MASVAIMAALTKTTIPTIVGAKYKVRVTPIRVMNAV